MKNIAQFDPLLLEIEIRNWVKKNVRHKELRYFSGKYRNIDQKEFIHYLLHQTSKLVETGGVAEIARNYLFKNKNGKTTYKDIYYKETTKKLNIHKIAHMVKLADKKKLITRYRRAFNRRNVFSLCVNNPCYNTLTDEALKRLSKMKEIDQEKLNRESRKIDFFVEIEKKNQKVKKEDNIGDKKKCQRKKLKKIETKEIIDN